MSGVSFNAAVSCHPLGGFVNAKCSRRFGGTMDVVATALEPDSTPKCLPANVGVTVLVAHQQ